MRLIDNNYVTPVQIIKRTLFFFLSSERSIFFLFPLGEPDDFDKALFLAFAPKTVCGAAENAVKFFDEFSDCSLDLDWHGEKCGGSSNSVFRNCDLNVPTTGFFSSASGVFNNLKTIYFFLVNYRNKIY